MTVNQASAVAQQFNLGEVNQIAFVVRSIEQSLPAYEAIFGKFQVFESTAEVNYRGRPITPRLRSALTQSNPQIELCEAVAGGPPHGDFLERHGEGLYHIRFKVASLADTLQAMEAAGFAKVYSGDMKSLRFAYVESPELLGRTLMELVEFLPAAR